MRPSLQSLGIAGFKIPQWETTPEGRVVPGGEYERLSVTTYATHDHKPLRAMWDEAFALEESEEREQARGDLRKICAVCGDHLAREDAGFDRDFFRPDHACALFKRGVDGDRDDYGSARTQRSFQRARDGRRLELESAHGNDGGAAWHQPHGQAPHEAGAFTFAGDRKNSVTVEQVKLKIRVSSVCHPWLRIRMTSPIKVAITGAAGQIGYSLLFRVASGAIFGPEQPVQLNLIEIPPALDALKGVVMELDDCAFPLLKGVLATADLEEGFRGVNWALLVGSVPRKAGMERGDLLGINGKIFIGQGQAIEKNAASDVRILVIGNPCNTNCLIAMNNAQLIPRDRWFAMTRLDENRAKAQLAQKAGVDVTEVTNMTIWGNHSATQYPDFYNAKIGGKSAAEVIGDESWLKQTFIPAVQQRGAAIIKARGLSSAGSAANAIIETVRSLTNDTPANDWTSVAVCSDGSYGVAEG